MLETSQLLEIHTDIKILLQKVINIEIELKEMQLDLKAIKLNNNDIEAWKEFYKNE